MALGSSRKKSYYFLSVFFAAFLIFLYGPMFGIILLSFQGPDGGLTFPMNGLSFHWFGELWRGAGVVDIGSAFRRSLVLGFIFGFRDLAVRVRGEHEAPDRRVPGWRRL